MLFIHMNEVEFGVLGEQVKNLDSRIEKGFFEIKELIKSQTTNFDSHVKENARLHEKLEKEMHNLKIEDIQSLKLDMARFKERWIMIGICGSVLLTLAEIFLHLK